MLAIAVMLARTVLRLPVECQSSVESEKRFAPGRLLSYLCDGVQT